MNINKYPDRTAYYAALAKTAYEALEAAVGEENLPLISCLATSCSESAESVQRKWMAIITLSSIIYLRTTVGDEDLSEVLTTYNFCTC